MVSSAHGRSCGPQPTREQSSFCQADEQQNSVRSAHHTAESTYPHMCRAGRLLKQWNAAVSTRGVNLGSYGGGDTGISHRRECSSGERLTIAFYFKLCLRHRRNLAIFSDQERDRNFPSHRQRYPETHRRIQLSSLPVLECQSLSQEVSLIALRILSTDFAEILTNTVVTLGNEDVGRFTSNHRSCVIDIETEGSCEQKIEIPLKLLQSLNATKRVGRSAEYREYPIDWTALTSVWYGINAVARIQFAVIAQIQKVTRCILDVEFSDVVLFRNSNVSYRVDEIIIGIVRDEAGYSIPCLEERNELSLLRLQSA